MTVKGKPDDLISQAKEALGYTAALSVQKSLASLDDAARKKRFKTNLGLAIGGNCNMDFLIPGLYAGLAAEGISVLVHSTEYDNWIGEALAGGVEADAWLIWISANGASNGGLGRGDIPIDGIAGACQRIVESGAQAIVILPEALAAEADPFSPFASWRRDLRDTLSASLSESVIQLDPTSVQLDIGFKNWVAGRYWTTSKCPAHPDAATVLAQKAAVVIARALLPAVRAVAVDLDNTLWGGVVGEDGVGGIALDPHSDGNPYLRLQRFLKDLSDSGVPVSVISKNNEDDARQPFRECPEMILKEDDIVHFIANWDNKHQGLARISEALNLGIDSLCFLDDSPHEREEARLMLPGLVVPELPEDPDERVDFLTDSDLFLIPHVSKGDRTRVVYYKADAKRRELAGRAADFEDYLLGLEMVLTPERICEANLDRVAQLVHKTNQFNLTTRRHGRKWIANVAENPDHYAFCYSQRDKFGDAGLIAVVLALAGEDAGGIKIDTWLMSCRVLGRGIEHAIAEHFAGWHKEHGGGEVKASYIPTAKNAHVAQFFDRLGFDVVDERDDGTKAYCTKGLDVPDHLAIIKT